MKGKSLSRVLLLVTPWTAAHQAPPSMGFSRQENWNRVPLSSPLESHIRDKYFLGGPVGKESFCNVRDLGLIPGLGQSPGEGLGYPFQYSWASLVAQMVKNPPAMQETRVQSLGQDDSLEKGLATHPSILAWRIPMDRGAWWAIVHRVAKSRT